MRQRWSTLKYIAHTDCTLYIAHTVHCTHWKQKGVLRTCKVQALNTKCHRRLQTSRPPHNRQVPYRITNISPFCEKGVFFFSWSSSPPPEFSQRNQTWGHRTLIFAVRRSLRCWSQSAEIFLSRQLIYVLILTSTGLLSPLSHILTHHTHKLLDC
jgi:hypothetical protein